MLSLHEEIRRPTGIVTLRHLPETAIRTVEALLPSLPDREASLAGLGSLLEKFPGIAERLATTPSALRFALTISSWSRSLADAITRYPEWLFAVAEANDLHRGFLAEDYERSLLESPLDLPLFRRRHLLRIVLRDVLRFADLSETAEDLSNLADAILEVTWRTVCAEVERQRAPLPAGALFSVIALGKLGGRELNYSSDIDLMFVHTGGDASHEFFQDAANRMTALLSAYTPEGMCYRVDLRLRPDGSLGEVCQTLEGAKKYYADRARDWELQMLIKARVAAGDAAPGRELLEFVEPLIYKTTTDFRTVEAVSETRARIHEKQARRARQSTLDIKLAKGGIRDIEFLVQCLQRLHGGRVAWVRHGGTLLALSRLHDRDLLSGSEYSRLASAYQFLRQLEHRLQFDEDRQTHSLPRETEQLDLLARRMPPVLPGLPSAGTLQRELDRHLSEVQDLYDRVIHSHRPDETGTVLVSPPGSPDFPPEPDTPERANFPSVNMKRFLDHRAPHFLNQMGSGAILRGQESFESFLEKVVAHPDWLRRLEENRELSRCTIDLFEHSQYFAHQLVGHPDLLLEVEHACGERQGRTGFTAPREPGELRRFFREQMVRIQSDSVYHKVPVFKTLKRTSDLAESVIAAAYDIALEDAKASAPPAGAAYTPQNQMIVIALGRLGMREFDLASDADLNFVIPDADASELLFWTGVAERLIQVVGAYTGDGVVFTIDTRLRPNGREGPLVQTEGTYKDYFANHAEAWEGISWMKARGVAGDAARAVAFLTEIQQIDWRRYGQNGRSRSELSHMRARLEREQGARNPLKAGPGGYYDIDFALMYLRLRGAGMFYKVLNTPARIEVIEQMGHLDRDDVSFLMDAAMFYRAVDHGMRVSTGHAEGRLPTNRSEVVILTELVKRWTSPGLIPGSLDGAAQRIRRDTRAFFHRIFGPA